MDGAVALTMAIGFAGGVELLVEQFKVWAMSVALYKARTPEQQTAIIQIVAELLGIFLAFGFMVNILLLLPGYAGADSRLGYLVTGLLIGLGSKFLHLFSDVITGVKDNLDAKATEHATNAALNVTQSMVMKSQNVLSDSFTS